MIEHLTSTFEEVLAAEAQEESPKDPKAPEEDHEENQDSPDTEGKNDGLSVHFRGMGWDSSDSILSVKDKTFLSDVDSWMDPLKVAQISLSPLETAQIRSDQSDRYWTPAEDDVARERNPFPRANPPVV